MQDVTKESSRYELVSENMESYYPLNKKRLIIGSTEACDILIKHKSVSTIHAVIEIKNNELKIYDMDSEHGTIVNGNKITVSSVSVGDLIVFGDYGVKLDVGTNLPPMIKIDEQVSMEPPEPEPPIFPKRVNKRNNNQPPKGSYDLDEYPLSKLKNAEFSKYIFEDADEIKNIFHFDEYQDAVEFIFLKRHEIISIDYKKLNKKPIYLVGSGKGKNSVEFPYLGKDQKIMIVRDGEGDCELINLEGFSLTVIDDKQTKGSVDIAFRERCNI